MRIACLGRLCVVSLLTVMVGCPLAPTASAAIPLGGGAGIVVDGSYCTLATIGHDNTGELVGITAASCGGPGAQVVAEGTNDTVGTVAAVDGELDYAVITFDSAKITPLANFAGFAINGLGPDPGPGQPICTQGGATGFNCGHVKFGGRPDRIAAGMPAWQPGDDGAPITVDDLLVGMIRTGFTGIASPPPHWFTHITFELFSAVLGDINGKGGPGAGFSPVGA